VLAVLELMQVAVAVLPLVVAAVLVVMGLLLLFQALQLSMLEVAVGVNGSHLRIMAEQVGAVKAVLVIVAVYRAPQILAAAVAAVPMVDRVTAVQA
jgi:hypothetical protein